jgi:hypothetical protein
MMFYIFDEVGRERGREESFDVAKNRAERMKEASGGSENFNIEKREWVYSTKTLAELKPNHPHIRKDT